MKKLFGLLPVFGLFACSGVPANDPIFLELKANAPTEIPERHLPKLRKGIVSCDVFEEGTSQQFMTCWWPNGSGTHAYMSYYRSSTIPPTPSQLIAPGGQGITPFIKLVP